MLRLCFVLCALFLFSCEQKKGLAEKQDSVKTQAPAISLIRAKESISQEVIEPESNIPDSLNENIVFDNTLNSFQIVFTSTYYSIAAAGNSGLCVKVYQDNKLVLKQMLDVNFGGDLEYSLLLDKIYYDRDKENSFVLEQRLNDMENNIDDSLIIKRIHFARDFSSLEES